MRLIRVVVDLGSRKAWCFMESSDSSEASLTFKHSDIERAATLLALAADSGAFQIQEFKDVGVLWERLNACLQQSKS